MSNLTSEQMDKIIDEKTIIQKMRVEYNPILDLMKVFTENGVPISITEKYMDVKNTTNPLLFNMPMTEYPPAEDEEKKNKEVDEINKKESFRSVVL